MFEHDRGAVRRPRRLCANWSSTPRRYVTLRRPPPSGRIVKTSPFWYATLDPSGDHDGSAPSPSVRRPVPSVFITYRRRRPVVGSGTLERDQRAVRRPGRFLLVERGRRDQRVRVRSVRVDDPQVLPPVERVGERHPGEQDLRAVRRPRRPLRPDLVDGEDVVRVPAVRVDDVDQPLEAALGVVRDPRSVRRPGQAVDPTLDVDDLGGRATARLRVDGAVAGLQIGAEERNGSPRARRRRASLREADRDEESAGRDEQKAEPGRAPDTVCHCDPPPRAAPRRSRLVARILPGASTKGNGSGSSPPVRRPRRSFPRMPAPRPR